MIKLLITVLVFSITVFSGCKKEPEPDLCIDLKTAPATNADGAATGMVNEVIPITVSFTVANGCGQFLGFTENANGNTIDIVVNARYSGCVCTQALATRTAVYNFRPTQAGAYTLKFQQANNSHVIKTVVVQ